jgi:uncharacterized membrane protein
MTDGYSGAHKRDSLAYDTVCLWQAVFYCREMESVMTTFELLKNAIEALIYIPILLIKFMWYLLRQDEHALDILADEVPRLVFFLSPIVYVACMIIALVTLLSSGGFKTRIFEIGVLIFCVGWITVTFLLSLQKRDARLIQAQSIQYYLLFIAFVQTALWVVGPENPRNEPSSVLILFMATSVTYVNERLVKPMIETHEDVLGIHPTQTDVSSDSKARM